MTRARREAVVDELPLPIGTDAPDLQALAIAVALEDAFDIVLTDREIAPSRLGTRSAVLHLLDEHLGPA